MTAPTGAPAAGTSAASTRAGERRPGHGRLWLWLAIATGLVVVALVAGAPGSQGDALDPSSTSATGTKALALLLEESGAHVDVTDATPDPSIDVAVLLSDTTSAAMAGQLERWVEAGGTLVVADPASSFAPTVRGSASIFGLARSSIEKGACTIDALGALDRVRPPDGGDVFEVPVGAHRCFDVGDGAFVVDVPTGRGHVVSIGSASVLTNDGLDQYDNAALAVDLMAPTAGTRVAVLWGMTSGGRAAAGERALADLVPTGVRLGLLQAAVAFLVYAWWRGRRLGRPVAEPQPVQIGGSELVSAVGNLLQQTGDPDRAARLLRADLRRRLAERLGLPPGAPPDVLAEVTAARTGVARDRVARAVTDIPVRSEDELLDLARDVDAIRTEVLHGAPP